MDNLKEVITKLRSLEGRHIELGKQIMTAAGGAIYPLDFLAIPVLNRSLCLLTGFCDLLEKKNFLAAAPLLRLQLDNLLRLQAAWLVERPHDFAMEVFRGARVKDIKDRDGKKMTDAYLVQKISETNPEFENLYKQTSGYIHLSDKHIFSSLGKVDKASGFSIKVGKEDGFVSGKEYFEALLAFLKVTMVLFSYLEGWALTKDGKSPKRPSAQTPAR